MFSRLRQGRDSAGTHLRWVGRRNDGPPPEVHETNDNAQTTAGIARACGDPELGDFARRSLLPPHHASSQQNSSPRPPLPFQLPGQNREHKFEGRTKRSDVLTRARQCPQRGRIICEQEGRKEKYGSTRKQAGGDYEAERLTTVSIQHTTTRTVRGQYSNADGRVQTSPEGEPEIA